MRHRRRRAVFCLGVFSESAGSRDVLSRRTGCVLVCLVCVLFMFSRVAVYAVLSICPDSLASYLCLSGCRSHPCVCPYVGPIGLGVCLGVSCRVRVCVHMLLMSRTVVTTPSSSASCSTQVRDAILTCPVDCIHYVDWPELTRLETEREGVEINFKARLVGNNHDSAKNGQQVMRSDLI